MSRRVFEGLKVAEFTTMLIGPLVGKYLADHGATVVRVESMSYADMSRMNPPYKDGRPGVNRSASWSSNNSSKLSVAINLKYPRGLDVARRLVAWSDVVIENFAPGVMERWGLGYAELVRIKPDIVMLSLSNIGQTGPNATQPGVGSVLQAITGYVHLLGWPDREPVSPYGPLPDHVTPAYAATALIAALDYHRRTGKGQHLDISQYESALQPLSPALLDWMANGRETGRIGDHSPFAAPHAAYPCRGDDQWCVIACRDAEEWQSLCRVIGRPELVADPRFATVEQRKANEDELDGIVSSWTMIRTAEEVMIAMQSARVPSGVVHTPISLPEDPQLQLRQHFRSVDHPEIGLHHVEAHAFALDASPAEVKAGPALGQHTERVLKELLSMGDEECEALLLDGVLF